MLSSFIASTTAFAFDIPTHAAMTAEAIKKSAITATPNNAALLSRLGLRDKDLVFGESYIDIGSSLTKRGNTNYEQKFFDTVGRTRTTGLILPNSLTISGWIIRGAIREDDNTTETPEGSAGGDEPGGVFQRVFGHFFNPVTGEGLSISGISAGPPATDWALTAGATVPARFFVNPVAGQNRYNIPTAREAMWRALTLKKLLPDGSLEAIEPIGNFANAETNEAERKAYWATTFRAVGDVMHLVQDMGQPQHTRNDAHAGRGCVPTGPCAAGHASFFESYLEARTLQSGQFRLKEGILEPKVFKTTGKQLVYHTYPVPKFATYRDFFSTNEANAVGRGLANYSNRGFYSFGTNIDNTTLLSPPRNGVGLTTFPVASGLVDMAGNEIEGSAFFKVGTVVDTAGGADAIGVKLSTVGIWDDALQQRSPAFSSHSLTHYNYNDQADLLVPRAVAYSAGIIDYFFRGEMQINLPDEGVYAIADYSQPNVSARSGGGFNKVKLRLTNTTPDILPSGANTTAVPQWIWPTGKLVAVIKFRRNRCYVEGTLTGEWPSKEKAGATDDLLKACRDGSASAAPSPEEIVVSNPTSLSSPLARGATAALSFTFSVSNVIPINAVDVQLQVIYRGMLGSALGSESDAVVVTTKDISEPTMIRISNDLDFQANRVSVNGVCTYAAVAYPGNTPITYNMGFSVAAGDIVNTTLKPGEFSVISTLGDKDPITVTHNQVGLPGAASFEMRAKQSQIDEAGVIAVVPESAYPATFAPYPSLRGVYTDWSVHSMHPYLGSCGAVGVTADLVKSFPDYNPSTPIPLNTLSF